MEMLGLDPCSLDSWTVTPLMSLYNRTLMPSVSATMLREGPVNTHIPFILVSEILFFCISGQVYHMPSRLHYKSVV